MERGLCFNDKDDSAVAQDGDYVYKAQWDGDPSWEASHEGEISKQ